MIHLRNCLSYCVLMLVLLISSSAVFSQDCYDYRNTFRIAEPYPYSGLVGTMAADQDRAIIPEGTTLHFLYLGDPDAISELDHFELGQETVLVESLDYLAVIATSTSLILLDWSNPSAPVVVQIEPLPSGTLALTRVDDYLLVSRASEGVDLYQCTQAAGLVFLGNADTPGSANDATIHQDWLVVADDNALLTMDISNPANAVPVDSYDSYWVSSVDRDVQRVDSQGEFLVVASVRWQGEQGGGPTKGLDLMTVNPAGQLILNDDTHFSRWDWPQYSLSSGLLHVASGDMYWLIDLANFPTPAATHETGHTTTKPLVATPNTVLHGPSSSYFEVYDVRFPFFVSPDPVWSGPDYHDIATGQVLKGFMLKEKTVWSGMFFSYYAYLYDVSNPQAAEEIATYSADGGMDDFEDASLCDADLERVIMAMVSNYGSGCRLFDRSTGETLSTNLPYGGSAVFDDSRIYQLTSDMDAVPGLSILDASEPGAVSELGFMPGSFGYKPFVIDQNIVVVFDFDMNIYDLSDPVAPVKLSSIADLGGTIMARNGDRLYLNTSFGDFVAIDISNLNSISTIWESSSMGVRSVDLNGDLAVMVIHDDFDNFLQIFDLVSNPTGPVAVSPPFPSEEGVYGALWDGDIVYDNRMQVYDVSQPSVPNYLGRGVGSTRGIHRDEQWIVTGAGCFPAQCVVSGVPDDGGATPIPFVGFSLQVAPNPFNPQTLVSFEMPMAGEARLTLFDIGGRQVRTLLQGHFPAGRQSVTWNGRDDQGRAQASGVYFARLEVGLRRESTKLVLLR